MLKSIHFPHDTNLYLVVNPPTDYTSLINYDLGQVQTWIIANKLSPLVKKTNYMIISNRKHIESIYIYFLEWLTYSPNFTL